MFMKIFITQEGMKEEVGSGENKITFQFSFWEVAPSCSQHRKQVTERLLLGSALPGYVRLATTSQHSTDTFIKSFYIVFSPYKQPMKYQAYVKTSAAAKIVVAQPCCM